MKGNEAKYRRYSVDKPAHFEIGATALAWLDTFSSKGLQKSGDDDLSVKRVEETFRVVFDVILSAMTSRVSKV